MDNKKWGSRFSTIFWWGLTILPLIIVLIQFIGYHLTFNSGISTASDLSSYHSMANGDFFKIFDFYSTNSEINFSEISLGFFSNMYDNLFSILGLNDVVFVPGLLAWMTSVQFYHLIFDFIVWLPRWFHKIMGKGFDDLK